MDRNQIFAKVTEIMQDVFDEEDLIANDETTADDVSNWDSANHIRLIMAIEETFHITFTSNEITAPDNLGELVDLIASKLDA